MRASRKHPLSVGETVFPLQWCNSPACGEFRDVEGKATIIAPAHTPHHYLVRFEGDSEACERGPLDENSTKEEVPQ